AGCDSSITTVLTVYEISSTTTISACDHFEWNGEDYSQSGNYAAVIHDINEDGCDSTANLVLTIRHSSSSTTTISACDFYDWNGEHYTASGNYSASFPLGNAEGCDSTANLILTIRHSSSSTTTISACDFYDWNGVHYTASGNYSASFPLGNAEGCDSTANLVLTISHFYFATIEAAICQGTDYLLPGGNLVNNGGTYVDSFLTTNNCDSIITTILTINENPLASASNNSPVCEGGAFDLGSAPDFASTYSWNGPAGYAASGQYQTITSTVAAQGGTYTV